MKPDRTHQEFLETQKRRGAIMTQSLSESIAHSAADHHAWQPRTGARPALAAGGSRLAWLEWCGPLAGRVLISQIFIISGIMKVMDPAATAAQMEGRGMFWIPFFLWATVAVEIGGGLALLAGYKTRLAALVLFLFLIPVTFTFHNFWTYPPDQQQQQMFFFQHNVALMGAMVLLMSFGPGPLSIDCRRKTAP
jgi:putative oxidoreductase